MTVADPTPSQAPRPTIHHTACTLDCPDSCSLEVEVRNGRVDKVRAAPPDVAHPLTGGFICSKVGRISRHLYGEDRLLHPARRAGRKGEGRLEPISWDRAIDLIVERMTEAKTALGGESVLPLSYGGSNGLLTQDTADAILFRRFGASTLARNVCAAPSTAAALGLYGKMAGVALEDYEHARLAIVWGANPSSTGIHLVPILRAARARGGKLVVVDPRRTPLAKQADLHLQPRPGTDLCLALALHRELFRRGDADLEFLAEHASGVDELRRRAEPWTFERAAEVTGVPVRDIARCYELYSASSPAVIRCGWGVERNRNGGSAVAAILALPAVGGKFRVRAGGYTMSNGAAFRFRRTRIDAVLSTLRQSRAQVPMRPVQPNGHVPAMTASPHDCIAEIEPGDESEFSGYAAVNGDRAARLRAPRQLGGAADGRGRAHARATPRSGWPRRPRRCWPATCGAVSQRRAIAPLRPRGARWWSASESPRRREESPGPRRSPPASGRSRE